MSFNNLLLAAAFLACCTYTWRIIHTRWRHGFVLPRRRRGPMPWAIGDFPLMFALSTVGSGLGYKLLLDRLGPAAFDVDQAAKPAHPILQLIYSNADESLKILAIFSAAVLAPVWEELLFRLLGQNWLEQRLLKANGRRERPSSRRRVENVSVLAMSLLFAALHFRLLHEKAVDFRAGILAQAIVNGSLAIVLLALLAVRTGRWKRRLYGMPRLIGRDLRLALSAFFAVTPVLMVVQIAFMLLVRMLPESRQIAPDPVPLFLFSLVLGYLAQRTRRITASIALHIYFNSFSLVLAFLLRSF